MAYYKCKICNKKHDILGDIEAPEPDLISNMSDSDKKKRITRMGSLIIIDREIILVNGIIYLELKNESEWLSWEVWASIAKNEFKQKIKELKTKEKIEPFEGNLESEIPFYRNSKNLKINIKLNETVEKTIFEIVEENHPLTKDQKNGISKERLIELMEMIYHNPGIVKSKNDKPFAELLFEAIEKADSQFIKKGKKVGIDILSENSVVFQLISNSLLVNGPEKDDGFGIHLPFDLSFEMKKEEIMDFKKSKYIEKFDFHTMDGIPTYQIDLKNDKDRILYFVKGLLNDVYKIKSHLSVDIFEI